MEINLTSLDLSFEEIRQNVHVCPHKTNTGADKDDRSSTFPMLDIEEALNIIYSTVQKSKFFIIQQEYEKLLIANVF